jgi:putative transposase
MDWKKLLGSITESVDEELRLRNEYLATENRLLRQQINGRVHLTDSDRKVLAEVGQQLGKQALKELATIAKPDTILAWHRTLVDQKGESSQPRKSVGRPRTEKEIEDLVVRMPTRTTRGAMTAWWALWLTWTIRSATRPWVISSSVTAFLPLRNAHTP